MVTEGSRKIRYIARLRQRLRRWRKHAAEAAAHGLLSDVPSGHIAVSVGPSCKRFVVPTTHLNHPLFQKLLIEAEEEYGFNNSGPLAIPCSEKAFEYILRCMARTESTHQHLTLTSRNPDESRGCCHVGSRSNLDFSSDSPIYLHGGTQSPVW